MLILNQTTNSRLFRNDRVCDTKNVKFFDMIENIVGKGENAGNQHFLLFQPCFLKTFFLRLGKARIVWKKTGPISYRNRKFDITTVRQFSLEEELLRKTENFYLNYLISIYVVFYINRDFAAFSWDSNIE